MAIQDDILTLVQNDGLHFPVRFFRCVDGAGARLGCLLHLHHQVAPSALGFDVVFGQLGGRVGRFGQVPWRTKAVIAAMTSAAWTGSSAAACGLANAPISLSK